MKIVYIKLMAGFYGGEKQTEDLIRSLEHKGHFVGLVSLPQSELGRRLHDIPQLTFNLFPYPASKLQSLFFVLLLPLHYVRAFLFLKRLIAKWQPDIFCLQEPHEKIVFTPLIHLLGRKTVWLEILYWRPFLAGNRLIFPLLIWSSRFMTGLIASSDFLVNQIKDFIPVEKITRIKHIIRPDEQAKLARAGRPAKAHPVIGFAGSLSRVKGIFVLLQAFNRLKDNYPDLTVRYAGSGAEAVNLVRQAQKFGLEKRVKLIGKQPIGDFFKTIDLLAVPSLYDNLPYVIQEAAFAGVPVVAAQTGGIPELFPEANRGWLFAPGNSKELTQKIVSFYELSASEQSSIASRNKEFLSQNFDYTGMIEKTEAYFSSLLK